MPRRTKKFLAQFALDSIARIESYIKESSFENWTCEPASYDATILRLQFLGFSLRDLSKKLPEGKLQNYLARQSQQYNALTKDYRSIDQQEIWNTVTIELPQVKGRLQALSD